MRVAQRLRGVVLASLILGKASTASFAKTDSHPCVFVPHPLRAGYLL